MSVDGLNTTNLLLGIMALVSVVQVLVIIGIGVMALRLYRHTVQTLHDIEQRQVAPVVARALSLMVSVEGILGDVRDVSMLVTRQTERVDSAIDHTILRVDRSARRVRDSVGSGLGRLTGFARGVRGVAQGFLGGQRSRETPAA